MEKLPPTSYIRMVDVWLIVCQMLPFLQVAILTIREAVADDTAVINHHGFGRDVTASLEPLASRPRLQ